MRLTELDPQFYRYETRREIGLFSDGGNVVERGHDAVYFPKVDRIQDAQGVMFLCPKCFAENGGEVGTHRVVCWSRSRGVPDSAQPSPGRWTIDGTGYHDLTLNGDPPGNARSVQITAGCMWHGHVTNGEVTP